MTRYAREHFLFLLLTLTYILLAGYLSSRFPPVNADEASFGVHGYNIWHGLGNRYSLYDDVFAPSVYPLRDATLEIAQGISNAWPGLWMVILGKSYWHARLSSVGAGVLVLFLFYGFGCRLGGRWMGLLTTGLLLANPIFLICSCLVRPEMLLLLAESFLFLFISETRDNFPWKFFLVGLFSGLAMGIHHNAAPFLAGLLVFHYMMRPKVGRLKNSGLVSLGFLSGMILLLASFDLYKLYIMQKFFFNEFYSLPLLSVPWRPFFWIADLFRSIIGGMTFYFQTQPLAWHRTMQYWTTAILLGLLGLSLSFVPSRAEPKQKRLKAALLTGFVTTFVVMSLLLRKKEMLYASAFFPFVIPSVALFFTETITERHRFGGLSKLVAAMASGMILLSCVYFTGFVRHYLRGSVPYAMTLQDIQHRIPDVDHKRVLGPAILWYGWTSPLFRDVGTTIKSHWYTGGSRDLHDWLQTWRPEVIIVDRVWKHIFLERPGQPVAIAVALGEPTHYLGTVDLGLSGDSLDIYAIDWNH